MMHYLYTLAWFDARSRYSGNALLVSLIGAPQMPHSIEKNYFIVYKYASQ